MQHWLSHYGGVVGQTYTNNAVYIEARRASVLGQLPASVAFGITTNGGANFSIHAASVQLAGNGWINVREIRRADTGAILDINWTTDTAWTASVGLNFGTNPITLNAYDGSGTQIGTAAIGITSSLSIGSVRDALRITEVHYNPAAPSTQAELAVSADNDEFEFMEVTNTGGYSIDTTGCKFTAGIDATLSASLASQESAVLVRNEAAFRSRYGAGPRIIGIYGPSDSLNNGGETITLVDATGQVIQSFSYNDDWFNQTDGGGYSLIPISPALALDRNLPTSWRSSTSVGGNPNGSDAITFTGSATADLDADGLNAFLEHALGTSDTIPNASGLTSVAQNDGSWVVSFSSQLNADDVVLSLETSDALANFTPATAAVLSATQVGSKLAQTWRITPPPGATRWFVRLTATAR